MSTQDWWLPSGTDPVTGAVIGEGFGHLHTELCFPHKKHITGEMTLTVTSILHENPGDFDKVVIQVWKNGGFGHDSRGVCGDGSSIACARFDPPRTLATCETLRTTKLCQLEATCTEVETAGVLVGLNTCKFTDSSAAPAPKSELIVLLVACARPSRRNFVFSSQ